MVALNLLPKSRLTVLALSGVALGATALISWAFVRHMRRNVSKRKPSYKIGHAIHIVDRPSDWEDVYVELMEDIKVVKVLGLDCEWVQKRPVALLQLSTPTGLCVLVRLFKFGSAIPSTLKTLLEDKSILKVGVAIVDDGKKLFQDYGLHVNGCVDLRHMLKRVRGVFDCPSRGLRGLATGILGVDINKNQSIRCGNWEAEQYTKAQIEYAATDAAIAVDIFVQIIYAKIAQGNQHNKMTDSKSENSHLESESQPESCKASNFTQSSSVGTQNSDISSSKAAVVSSSKAALLSSSKASDRPSSKAAVLSPHAKENTHPVAPLAAFHEEENSSSESFLKSSQEELRAYKFSDTFHVQDTEKHSIKENQHQVFWRMARSLCQGIIGAPYTYKGENKGVVPTLKSGGKVKDSSAYSVRKRPLWDNCRLEAPDGTVLCTCDTRKAQWYLDKELADKISDNPLTVRLHFEPARRPQEEMNFYKQEKQNICVVCGHDKDYIRKFVIPYEYRKYLPFALKDHSSHDVLLLCTSCHRRSCDFDAQLRLLLAQECNAPVESGSAAKIVLDHDLQKIRSAGRALKLSKDSIPVDRVTQLEEILCTHFGVDCLTEDLIEQASEIDARHTSSDYVPHAKRVVRHMVSSGGLLAFQARWRQHFVDTMKPRHLPPFWSVDFVPDGWLNSQTAVA